jgi:GDP-D-mannose dehydratase
MMSLSNVQIVLQGDILSADLVLYVLRQRKIDTIMHFAAQSHVGSFLCPKLPPLDVTRRTRILSFSLRSKY